MNKPGTARQIVKQARAGAGSNLGTVAVARSDPDGTTLLLTTSAFLANPALYKNVPYDPAKDFTPVADLAVSPNIIATQPRVRSHRSLTWSRVPRSIRRS